MERHPPRRGRIGAPIVAVIFGACWLNAWLQAGRDLVGIDSNPMPLTLLQLVSGAAALAATLGAWTRRPWAPVAAVLYGIVTGIMIIAVGPLLGLAAEERQALPAGAAAILVTALVLAWYLRRITRHQADR